MPDTSVASASSIPFRGVLYMASRQEGCEAKLAIWGCKRSLLVIHTAVRASERTSERAGGWWGPGTRPARQYRSSTLLGSARPGPARLGEDSPGSAGEAAAAVGKR